MKEELEQIVSVIARGNPEVTAAVIVSANGAVQASESATKDMVQAAIAFAVPLRELLDRTAAELGCGGLKGTLVEGSSASFALADVDGDRTAIVIGASGAAAGSLR